MVYALNLFNLVPGREDDYRTYTEQAGRIIHGVGGRVVNASWKPIRRLHDDRERRHMIIVQFPSEDAFRGFLDEAERQGIHALREASTADYIWTLYEPWDLRAWMAATAESSSDTG
jgi:uncharacterized protein (DUF1330 family)